MLQITSRCHVMALIWIIDYSVISAIWTRIWHPSFRYEIPEKDRLIFFIKMAQKIITDLLNLSTNNVFMCIHSMTFLSSLNIWTGINMHALQKPELSLKEWQHPFVFISVIKDIFLKWLVLRPKKKICVFTVTRPTLIFAFLHRIRITIFVV